MYVFYRLAFAFSLLASLLTFTACNDKGGKTADTADGQAGTKPPPPPPARVFTPYAIDSSKITEIKPGIKVYLLEKGKGNLPKKGEQAVVHYHGMLTNGKVFDSSFERGQPYGVIVGGGGTIRGWEEAIPTLPVGTKAVLILAPEMGYGDQGAGPNIPPKSTLVFNIEILGILPGN
jgi:peptidylprolyl isomerase